MIGVLIVDDEHLTRELHREYVRRVDGFDVVAESTGARGAVSAVLSAPGRTLIDLVLLDMTMPDGHGLDVARHIRAHAADVDIIAITSVRDAETVHRAANLGVAQYLVKPFTFATFRDRLHQYTAFREHLAQSAGPATQAEVDTLMSALRPPATTETPKGLAAGTLERVARIVREHGPLSATDAADRLGTSRVAARRYLEHLADTHRIHREARYGTRGRPQTHYHWTPENDARTIPSTGTT